LGEKIAKMGKLVKVCIYITLIPGTDVIILKIFSPKKLAKLLAYFAQTAATFCKNWLLRKTAIFSAENWQKSQKMWP
jgi:hypothetical protein